MWRYKITGCQASYEATEVLDFFAKAAFTLADITFYVFEFVSKIWCPDWLLTKGRCFWNGLQMS